MWITPLTLEDSTQAAHLHQAAFYKGWIEKDFQAFLDDPLVFGLKIQKCMEITEAKPNNPKTSSLRASAGGVAIQEQQTSCLKTSLKLTTGLLRPALCRARNDDRGLFSGYILWREVEDEAEILTLVVASSCQRKGLGDLLLSALFERLKEKGISKLFLEVAEDNEKAKSFYIKNGFNPLGKRPNYYERPDHKWVDGLNFFKEIEAKEEL